MGTPNSHLVFDKGAKTIKRGKDSLFNKWSWEKYMLTCKRMKQGPYLKPYKKINSKCMKDLNVRAKAIKLRRKHRGREWYQQDEGASAPSVSSLQSTTSRRCITQVYPRDQDAGELHTSAHLKVGRQTGTHTGSGTWKQQSHCLWSLPLCCCGWACNPREHQGRQSTQHQPPSCSWCHLQTSQSWSQQRHLQPQLSSLPSPQ